MDPENKKGPRSPISRDGLSKRLQVIEKQYRSRAEALRAYGIPKTTYDKWIKGISSPSVETLAGIAELAGVTLDWLVLGEGNVPEQKRERISAHDQLYTSLDRRLMGEITEDLLMLTQRSRNPMDNKELMESTLDIYDALVDVDGRATRQKIKNTMLKLIMRQREDSQKSTSKTADDQQSA